MKLDYFVYNGVKYPSGTQIKIKEYPDAQSWKTDLVYFVYHDKDNHTAWYREAYTNKNMGVPMNEFKKMIVEITGKCDNSIHPPQAKQLKDSQIPRLLFGWIWYVFIMAISIIFKGRLIIWTVATVWFFNWRKKVIKDEGYYVER